MEIESILLPARTMFPTPNLELLDKINELIDIYWAVFNTLNIDIDEFVKFHFIDGTYFEFLSSV